MTIIADNFNKLNDTFFCFVLPFLCLCWLKTSRVPGLCFKAPGAALADRRLQNGYLFPRETGKILQNNGWFHGVWGGLHLHLAFILVCVNSAICWKMRELITNWQIWSQKTHFKCISGLFNLLPTNYQDIIFKIFFFLIMSSPKLQVLSVTYVLF